MKTAHPSLLAKVAVPRFGGQVVCECEIEFESRKNIAPLRLADLALWLLRRRLERGDAVARDSAALLDWVSEHGRYYETSQRQLAHMLWKA
jgi:hypothetical protein